MSKWIKIPLYSLATLTILLACLIASLSLIAKQVSLNVLAKQDLAELGLDEINIRLFSSEVLLKKFIANKTEQRGVELNSFDMDFSWMPLLDNQAIVNHITLDGLTVMLQQTEDGNFKVGLEPSESKDELDTTIENTPEQNVAAAPWDVKVKKIILSNNHFRVSNYDATALIDITFDLHIDELKANTEGNASFAKLEIKNQSVQVNQTDTLSWSSFLLQDFSLSNNAVALESLRLDNFALSLISSAAQSQSMQSTLPALLSFAPTDMQNLQFSSAEEDAQLKTQFDIALNKVKVNEQGEIDFEKFALQEFNFLIDNEDKLNWNFISLDKLKLSEDRLSLEKINIDSLATHIIRLQNGNIKGLDSVYAFIPGDTSENSTDSEAEKNEEPQEIAEQQANEESKGDENDIKKADNFHWKLNQLVMTGKNSIKVDDLSLQPALNKTLTLETLSISELDSQKPEALSELALKITGDEHELIELKGKLSPLAEKPDGYLSLALNNITLTPFSSFATDAIGYDIVSGLLNLNTSAKINKGYLDSKSNIVLNKFRIAVSDQEKADEVSSSLQMPLDMALNVVRDKGNIIRLDIPVNGELTDPNFEINKVIRKALRKSLQSATITYLQYAFQPWGAALFVGKHLKNAVTAVNFDPITFQAGDATLSPEMQNYLGKIGEFLNKKEGLSITACAISVAADSEVLAAKDPNTEIGTLQKNLSKQRVQSIRNFLIEQHKVSPGQIVICQAKHTNEATPRVEIGL